jgi:hypothetical protein
MHAIFFSYKGRVLYNMRCIHRMSQLGIREVLCLIAHQMAFMLELSFRGSFGLFRRIGRECQNRGDNRFFAYPPQLIIHNLSPIHCGGTDPRAGGRDKEPPSRRKEGYVPLGYSGRTASRREQRDVLPESQNVGVE